MKRIVGIDYGRKRVGVAVSDPLRIFATAIDVVSSANIIEYLKNYARTETVETFVVGYPKNLDGRPAECAQYVDEFLKRLGNAFPGVPVVLEDERFTTVLAQRAMLAGGMKKGDRRTKGAADKISSAIILQGYLDRLNGKF